jgi:thiol-disulfide isomerase/thioredoxin
MPVLHATDNDLRTLIFNNDSVIVKYVKEDCEYCRHLEPFYAQFSEDAMYRDIRFLKVDSGQNPVAQQEVGQKDMPFVSVYKKGLLIECGSVRTEEELRAMLQHLRNFHLDDIVSGR